MSVFCYQIYQASLLERLLNREACQVIQHAFAKQSLVQVNVIQKVQRHDDLIKAHVVR